MSEVNPADCGARVFLCRECVRCLTERLEQAEGEVKKTTEQWYVLQEALDRTTVERDAAKESCNAYWHDIMQIGSLCEQTADEFPLKAARRMVEEQRRLVADLSDWKKAAKEIVELFDPLAPEAPDWVVLRHVCLGAKMANSDLRDAKRRAREAAQVLIQQVGADGPTNVEDVAKKAADLIASMKARIEKLERPGDYLGALKEFDRREAHRIRYNDAFVKALEEGKSRDEAHEIAGKASYAPTEKSEP